MSSDSIISIKNLSVTFKTKQTPFYAVKDVSFDIKRGETVALVGESGCGKSTIAKSIVGIQPITSGAVYYNNEVICNDRKNSPLCVKRDIQMIFQDPYSSLNPRMTIKEILKEPLYIYNIGTKKEQDRAVNEMLSVCCLPRQYKYRYPHELSGGERQRVSIARALISKPKVLICDEPTHALDVSVQASIINLLKDLKDEYNLSLLFISHDLGLVRILSDETLVMYNGEIMEKGRSIDVFSSPCHPFTKNLLQAVPSFIQEETASQHIPEASKLERQTYGDNMALLALVNDLQQSLHKKTGTLSKEKLCPYLDKCPVKKACCLHSMPQPQAKSKQEVKCHLFDEKYVRYFSKI